MYTRYFTYFYIYFTPKNRITIKQARSYRPHIHSPVNYYVNLDIAFFSCHNQIQPKTLHSTRTYLPFNIIFQNKVFYLNYVYIPFKLHAVMAVFQQKPDRGMHFLFSLSGLTDMHARMHAKCTFVRFFLNACVGVCNIQIAEKKWKPFNPHRTIIHPISFMYSIPCKAYYPNLLKNKWVRNKCNEFAARLVK